MNPPGIFNDAIGPVMRGPSSSHTAGSHRIGSVISQFSGGKPKKVTFRFHRLGSLATTYQTQGSDIGLAAGLIGMEMTDPLVPESLKLAANAGVDIQFIVEDYPADHPNTYVCEVEPENGKPFTLVALSTGGGLIELTRYNDFEFSRLMDLPTVFAVGPSGSLTNFEHELAASETNAFLHHKQRIDLSENSLLILEFSSPEAFSISADHEKLRLFKIAPVYPVLGFLGSLLPFHRCIDLEENSSLLERPLSELALDYEAKRSSMTASEIHTKMEELVQIFRNSIDTGLSGTNYSDRILGAQSPEYNRRRLSGQLLPDGPMSKMTSYIMAIMESKSAMEVIVAAPTAGSAGGLPGTLIAMAEELEADQNKLINAFLAAGLIGVFISADATFAAEVAGCQAETGVGAAMAAAGLIELSGGTAQQALGAASIALQNIMGLICDPVGNRVEIPCLGRNVQSGANALTAANMILGGVDPVIPLSESIKTMLDVGNSLPRELRCTALGGLAITKAAKEIEAKLTKKNN